MNSRTISTGTIALLLIAVAGTGLFTTRIQADREAALEAQLAVQAAQVSTLEEKLTVIASSLTELAGENSKVSASLKEALERKSEAGPSQEDQLIAAVAKVAPAVVSIVITKDVPLLSVIYENPFGDNPLFKDFNVRIPRYIQNGTETRRIGAGTGFIITPSGYIVTNRHVVTDVAASYTALLADGTQKQAQVVYRDHESDIALLKIEGSAFPVASISSSKVPRLGQSVVAIGNALGEYSNSVSTGIISGLNRTIDAKSAEGTIRMEGVIQTDAAINPGNSGGPLIDLSGEVLGVNVATVIGSENISFSIPIEKVRKALSSFIRI
jgi:serine protease Do